MLSLKYNTQARKQKFFFLGRGVFLEFGHFDKHLSTTGETKAPQRKSLQFFHLENLKNFILNEMFYP